MTWTQIVARARRHSGEWVSVSVRKDRNSARRCRISISQPLVKRLGWEYGNMVLVQIGAGEHAGRVRMMLEPLNLKRGYKLGQNVKTYFLNIPAWDGLDPELRIDAAEFEVDDQGGLIVDVGAPPPSSTDEPP